MAKTGKYEKFRELLKNGIGTRGRKEFADEAGLTRETISRLLNKEIINQPSRDTINRISKHLPNCSVNDLLESCGYPRLSLEEEIEQTETNFLAELNSVIFGKWESVQDMVKAVDASNGTVAGFGFLRAEKAVEDANSSADFERTATAGWMHEDIMCSFEIVLRYVKNRNGNPVFVEAVPKYALDEAYEETNERGYRKYKYRHTLVTIRDEEEMIRAVLGDDFTLRKKPVDPTGDPLDTFLSKRCIYYVQETILGLGFSVPLPETVEEIQQFTSFVCNHARAFAAAVGDPELFDFIVNFNGDPDNFVDDMDANQVARNIDPLGSQEVVAKIVSYETKMQFEAMFPTVLYETTGSYKVDIIYRCSEEEQENPDTELFCSLGKYAEELGSESFGAIYHEKLNRKQGKSIKTKDFYVSFGKGNKDGQK